MTLYKIKFINNSSLPNSRDYTLYSAAPAVKSSGPVKTWSNSLSTKVVAAKGGQWNLAINDAPYAFCGTSRKPLAAGENINVSATETATLSYEGSGSTHTVYTLDGAPAFRDERYTAPPRAFEINTGNDFFPGLNFSAGYALTVDVKSASPAATFALDTNSQYIVQPPVAPKLYLVQNKITAGELIDPNAIYLNAAVVDFAQHPGQYNAVVTLDDTGIYHVEYMVHATFAMRVASSLSPPQVGSSQLTQLKHQIKVMSDLVDTALGITAPTQININSWACSYHWTRAVSDYVAQRIANLLADSMRKRGYALKYKKIQPYLTETFTHPTKNAIGSVYADWVLSWKELPPLLQQLLTRPHVERIYWAEDVSASQVDDVELPVLRPDYACSVTWLEGPNDPQKQLIAKILAEGMVAQDYIDFEPEINDTSLILKVWHADRPSVETVQAAWETAVKRLLELYLMNYVTNPHVEEIYHPQEDGATTASAQVSAQIWPPLDPGYSCKLTWLEGPSPDTQKRIKQKLTDAMFTMGYTPLDDKSGAEKLDLWFSHNRPWSEAQTLKDWTQAYDSLGFEKMYVTGPEVEPLIAPQANAAAEAEIFPPPPRSWDCAVTWVGNPNQLTKARIAFLLVGQMHTKGYQILNTNLGGDQLDIIVQKPGSTLPAVVIDWLAAVATLGPYGKTVTSPRVRPAPQIANSDASISSLPVMPPTYVGTLEWLEGPGQRAKESIIIKLALFLAERNYYVSNVRDTKEKLTMFFSHDFPHDLPAATAVWTAAYNSLGTQQMFVTNPKVEDAVVIQAGNVSLSDLVSDEDITTTNGVEASNGASTQQQDPPVGIASAGEAPTISTSAVQSESLEEKKRRALELLKREGLVGIAV